MAHWYIKKDGVVQRFRPLKKDGTEYQRITEGMALKAGAVRGTTDIHKVLGGIGGLGFWYMGLGVQAGLEVGLTNPAPAGLLDEEGALASCVGALLKSAKAVAKELSEQSAEEGKEIHDAIQTYLEGGPPSDNTILNRAQADAMAWVNSMGLKAPFRCEHALMYRGELLGEQVAYAGTADLVTPCVMGDWKTVNDDAWGSKRKPKWSEAAQLAAYRFAAAREGLTSKDAPCYNLYFGRQSGALLCAHQWTERALEHGLWLHVEAIKVAHKIGLLEGCIARSMKG